MEIPIQPLTPETFAPYGQIIAQPERPNDASGPGWQYWGELTTLSGGDRPYGIGFLDLRPAHGSFDWAERHMHSDELIVPLNGDCLVYVAPPDYLKEPARMPALERFHVFQVKCGQAVLLHPGVWHGAPMAMNAPCKAMVILLKGSGQQDVYINRFEPVEIGME